MAFIAMAGRAQTDTITVDGLLYYIDVAADTAKVIDYDPETEPVSITIPEEVRYKGGAYTVTSIGQMMLRGERFTKYCDAFFRCTSLQSVVLPETLLKIGASAFEDCTSLANIKIPTGVTDIGNSAFRNCTSLVNIDIPSSVTHIRVWAFYGCTSLKSVAMPDALQMIDNMAFEYCTSLESIVIPDGVTSIGSYAFAGCSSLASVSFLTSSLESISTSGAFSDCISLSSIVLPEGLKTIGVATFMGCSSLASVVLPSTLTTVRASAFRDCPALASMILPASLQSMENSAFDGTGLKDVYSLSAVPPAISDNTFGASVYRAATLHVPADAVADYRDAMGWLLFDNIAGDAEEMVSISAIDASEASIAAYADGVITTATPATINVYAQSGARVMHAADATMLSLESLPRGIYIINVEAGTERQVMKIAR